MSGCCECYLYESNIKYLLKERRTCCFFNSTYLRTINKHLHNNTLSYSYSSPILDVPPRAHLSIHVIWQAIAPEWGMNIRTTWSMRRIKAKKCTNVGIKFYCYKYCNHILFASFTFHLLLAAGCCYMHKQRMHDITLIFFPSPSNTISAQRTLSRAAIGLRKT